jgi:hypothetical protein
MTDIRGILEAQEPELHELAEKLQDENSEAEEVERLIYRGDQQPVFFIHGETYYSLDLPEETENFELTAGRPLKGKHEPDQEMKQQMVENGTVESMEFWEEQQDPALVSFSRKEVSSEDE